MTEAGHYFLRVNITAIERVAKKDPVFRFDAHTNLPGFRTTQFRDVRRTHHEFEKLHDHLIHENPECLVPALYPSSTSYGVGTEEDEKLVKANVQHWIDLVTADTILVRDAEMMHFVESDFGWSPIHGRGKPFSGPKRRAIKQLAPPPDDTPELEQARPVAKAIHILAGDVAGKLHRQSKSRRTLALAEQDFGVRLSNIANLETFPGLANGLGKLARTVQSVSDARSAQATIESATLGDAMSYVCEDAYTVKETLTTRQILTRDYNQAQNATRTRTASAGRMKSTTSISSSKVDEALASLEESKALEQALGTRLARVTSNLQRENRRWKTRTSAELKAALKLYARRQIDAERRALAILESVRPDIRAIDGTGGLSRLGRERVDRQGSYVGPSQGPDGDAWSGIKRSDSTGKGGSAFVVHNSQAPALPAAVQAKIDQQDKVDARNAASVLAGS